MLFGFLQIASYFYMLGAGFFALSALDALFRILPAFIDDQGFISVLCNSLVSIQKKSIHGSKGPAYTYVHGAYFCAVVTLGARN